MVKQNILYFQFSKDRVGAGAEGEKNRAIVCETNYPKEFMKIVHAWMDPTIRFIEVKPCVAENRRTSLGG